MRAAAASVCTPDLRRETSCASQLIGLTPACTHLHSERNVLRPDLPPGTTQMRMDQRRAPLFRHVAALRPADHDARGLFNRLDRRGELRLRALVADDDFPKAAHSFGDFHRQPK